jgi:hypothetical protein
MARVQRILTLLAVTGALLVAAPNASANNFCNQTIAAPGAYVLPHDHFCPAGTAITIDADGVNLDLNGFRVAGGGTGVTGIRIEDGSDDVLIFNGTVMGFDTGIEGGDCDGIVPSVVTNNFQMDNVDVRNSGTDGVRLCLMDGNTQVLNSAIVNSGDRGIEISGTAAVSFSLVSGAVAGIDLDPNGANFDEVYVLASRVQNVSTTAIQISASGQNSYAEVRDGWIRGGARGITTSGDVTTLISGMTIRDIRLEAIHAFASLTGGGYPVMIEDTTVTDVGEVSAAFPGAIVIKDRPGGGSITSTTVRDVTGGPAILFACSTSSFLVEHNVVTNADGDGIVASDAASHAGDSCANILRPDALIINENGIRSNGGSGVSLQTGRGHQLNDNLMFANGGDGAFLSSTVTESFLTGNLARRNGDDGFQLDTADLELTDNTARQNADWGFETNFVGPVLVDNGQSANNNGTGECSDPTDLPNTAC